MQPNFIIAVYFNTNVCKMLRLFKEDNWHSFSLSKNIYISTSIIFVKYYSYMFKWGLWNYIKMTSVKIYMFVVCGWLWTISRSCLLLEKKKHNFFFPSSECKLSTSFLVSSVRIVLDNYVCFYIEKAPADKVMWSSPLS